MNAADGQQLGWRRRIARGPLAQRLAAEGHRGCGHGVVQRGHDGRGLELERELGVAGIERRRCAIENLDRLREALGAAECEPPAPSLPRRLLRRSARRPRPAASARASSASPALASAIPRSSSNADRSPGGGGSASARRRKTASDSGAPCFRAAQAASTSRSTTQPSPAGSLTSRCLATRSCAPGCSASSSGGTAVALRALCAGELRIDPAADDRMDERQRPAGLEDPRGRQQVGRFGCLEPRRGLRVAPPGEGRSARGPPAPVRAAPHAPAADGAGGEPSDRPFVHRSFDVARGLRGRSDAFLAQRLHEHAHQERRPARCAQAGVDDDRIRSLTEPRLNEAGRRRLWSAEQDGSHQRMGSLVTVASSSASVPASRGRVATTSATSSSSSRVSRKAR